MQREIDMAPYEEQFTKLERLYYERNAAMNIVAYIAERGFSETQYNKIYDNYIEATKAYEQYLGKFEEVAIIPNIDGRVNWNADFERRVVYVTPL